MKKSKRTKERATRNTLPKAIAAAWKAGDKHDAMQVAIFGRKPVGRCRYFESVTDLARRLYFLLNAEKDAELQKELASCADAVRCSWKEIENELKIHKTWNDSEWFKILEQEFQHVCDEDANVRLFSQFGTKQNPHKNPNWFRQVLVANIGLVETKVLDKQSGSLIPKQPHPLNEIANKFHVQVKTLRREVRKMGIKPGKAGRPKRRKPTPLI